MVEIELTHLAKLEVTKGDILVLRHPRHLSHAAATYLTNHFERLLSSSPQFEGVKVVVLDDGLELAVLQGQQPLA